MPSSSVTIATGATTSDGWAPSRAASVVTRPPPRTSQAASELRVAASTCSRVIPTASSPRVMASQTAPEQLASAAWAFRSLSWAMRSRSAWPSARASATTSSAREGTTWPLR
jgi:hypothetical protein